MNLMFVALIGLALAGSAAAQEPQAKTNPRVALETNKGKIVLELFADKAPKTVDNFLQYVKSGHYNGITFHRVIKDFMIQAGGFDAKGAGRAVNRKPIQNEADNGLTNDTGTVAMARTNDPHSASAQFFINLKNNAFLNHKGKTPEGWGYCVFGKVVEGMDVVNAIAQVPVTRGSLSEAVPNETIVINKASVLP
jgi:peptidyl-prolyl cis-trans isomerase B (cyclophilin B)